MNNFNPETCRYSSQYRADNSKDSEFIEYVLSFYGQGGIYGKELDKPFTSQEVAQGLKILKERHKVEYESLDRERVRDIVVQKFGKKWLKSK